MKYAILILLFFTFIGQRTAIAQLTADDRAIVYYIDGSVFIGQVITENPLEILLVASTKDTLHINKDLVLRIRRTSKDILLHNRAKFHYTSGQFVSTTMGWGLNANPSFDWDVILGRRLNKTISVGLGGALSLNSVQNFKGIWLDNNFAPVFAYGRYYLTHKRARLFAASRIGYGFATNFAFGLEHTGGFHFQPSIGVHFASRKYSRFILTLSQILQNTRGAIRNFDLFSNPIDFKYNFWYNRTMLKFGVEFR